MHHYRVICIVAASLACAWLPAFSYGQTTSAATPSPAPATSGSTTTAAAGTGATSTAMTATATSASAPAQDASRYLTRLQRQYPTLTSRTNLESLVHGLRTGSAITLTGTQGTTATSTTFVPPTRPMGYGNITRAMTLATRELTAAGITNPTPQQLQTALMGGTLTTASGSVQMQGVLQLRSQGLGWGQIAHTVGVQPGMASRHGDALAAKSAAGITTAAGSATGAPAKTTEHATIGGRGIVTAAGTNPTVGSYRNHGSEYRSAGTMVAANAARVQGMVNGAGSGQGSAGATAHGGKH